MKKAYRKPTVKMVNYIYDEQVVASSDQVLCDQGWTRMTTSKPEMKTAFCAKCDSTLIWINQQSWE